MTHLFDDPAAFEAACAAWDERLDHRRQAEASLKAALAALPREELVEKAARAIDACESQGWVTDQQRAESALVAIGLIPEHITPEEDE